MATYKIGTWELHVHSGRAQIKKERRRQMENAKRSEHQKTIYFSGADVRIELLASWTTTPEPPQSKTVSTLARFIIPQRHNMTQVAHIAGNRYFSSLGRPIRVGLILFFALKPCRTNFDHYGWSKSHRNIVQKNFMCLYKKKN